MAEQTPAEKAAAEKAAAEKAAADKAAAAKVTGIKYVGSADVRNIDSAAFKSLGIEDQSKVSWHAGNKHTVPVEDLNKDAIDWLTSQTGEFKTV